MEDENTIVRFQTKEGVCLKALFERLQRFRDFCLEFTTKGIFMNVTTISSSILAILSLDTLDNYMCTEQTSFGVEVYNWFKLFKKVTKDDTVTLTVTKQSIKAGQPYATINVENDAKQILVAYNVCFLNIELEKIDIPSRVFDAIVMVNSLEFFRVLRFCETGGCSNVKIYTYTEDCKTYLVVETIFGEDNSSEDRMTSVKVRLNVTGKTQGANFANVNSPNNYYKLENLLDVARSGTMYNGGEVMLYLTNDVYPLIVDYRVGTMGSIKYCLAPIMNPDEPDADMPVTHKDAADIETDEKDNIQVDDCASDMEQDGYD
jgi:hypothetical protein